MESKSRVMIIAVFFFCLSLQFPSRTAARFHPMKAPQLVTRMCGRQAVSFKFCVYSMLRNPGTWRAKNMADLARVALGTAKAESAGVRDFFKGTRNPASKDCAGSFNTAIKFLELRGSEEGEASYDVHNALDSMNACQNKLATSKVNDPKINKKIKHWKKVYDVAYAAVLEAEKEAS